MFRGSCTDAKTLCNRRIGDSKKLGRRGALSDLLSNLALANSIGLNITFETLSLEPIPSDPDKLSYWTLLGWLERREAELKEEEEPEGSKQMSEVYRSEIVSIHSHHTPTALPAGDDSCSDPLPHFQ